MAVRSIRTTFHDDTKLYMPVCLQVTAVAPLGEIVRDNQTTWAPIEQLVRMSVGKQTRPETLQ